MLFVRGSSHYYLAHDEATIKDLTAAAKVYTDNAEIYLMLVACKNNLKDGSGCADYQRAFELGNVDAERIIAADCLPAASKKRFVPSLAMMKRLFELYRRLIGFVLKQFIEGLRVLEAQLICDFRY